VLILVALIVVGGALVGEWFYMADKGYTDAGADTPVGLDALWYTLLVVFVVLLIAAVVRLTQSLWRRSHTI
jgi:hypothetical protein